MAFITGTPGNDELAGTDLPPDAGDDIIWGFEGNDTLAGLQGNDVLEGGDGNDTLDGGDDDDTLYGGAGDDILQGGAGDDILYELDSGSLDGGDGTDTADFSGHSERVVIRASGLGGDASGNLVSLVSVENLIGSSFNDFLFGDSGSNVIDGSAGADTLRGRGGDDVLRGGSGIDDIRGEDGIDTVSYYADAAGVTIILSNFTASTGDTIYETENVTGSNQGNDTLIGNGVANVLAGWGGDDVLRGDAGADTLDGGAGRDAASYSISAAGVTVDLAAGTASGGNAEGDTLIGIENLTGSNLGNDTLIGTAGANVLAGLGGNDVLRGGAGADRLDGGTGSDTASYYTGAAGVTVNLAAGTAGGGDAQGDTLVSIEKLTGSNLGNDSLVGSAGANTLAGWGGNDLLRGGAGADRLDGGAGSDTASYYNGTFGVTVNLAAGLGSGGDAQGDTLVSIENVNGSTGADQITGSALANALNGWAGQDVLRGRGGADRFVFSATSDSKVTAADRITDFSHAQGDRVDLSAIDANTGAAGNQAFSFIGSGAFTHHAGQLRYASNGTTTTIAGDVNGDGVSDFHIQLTGAIGLVAADFVL